jgi:ribokinase
MHDAATHGRGGSGRAEGGDVVVLGSANADLVLGVAELPPGETVLARGRARACGSKGANQALAAARAGARTSFLGAIGDDADGAMLRAELCEAGVDLSALRTVDAPTGVAVVLVDARGENSVVVVPGANADASALGAASSIRPARATPSAACLPRRSRAGDELEGAVARANAAGSLAVEHAGAAPAMPSAEAIAARLARG